MGMQRTAAALAMIVGLAAFGGNAAPAQDDTKPPAKAKETATQADNVITVQPMGLSFRIPDSWLKWQKQFNNNVHLTAEELAAVKDGAGEWDTEFAEVVNALAPFDRCVAAAGAEGWGKNAVSFVDIQMRVYLLDDSVKAIGERVVKDAPDAVRKLFTPRRVQERNSHGEKVGGGDKTVPPDADLPPADMKVPVQQDETNGWTRSAFAYRLHYGDYGSMAKVDVCARQFGERTVVVAFMYSAGVRNPKDINAILDSFALLKGATK